MYLKLKITTGINNDNADDDGITGGVNEQPRQKRLQAKDSGEFALVDYVQRVVWSLHTPRRQTATPKKKISAFHGHKI